MEVYEVLHENLDVQNLKKCFDALCLSEEFCKIKKTDHESQVVNTVLDIQSSAEQSKLDTLKNNYELFLNLKQVTMSCALTKVPNVLFKLKYLTVLNLSSNSLEILPEEIGNLLNLKILKLSHNYLNCLPISLMRMLQLHYLDISNNKFCEIPSILYYGLGSLRILDLSSNKIAVFDNPPRCLSELVALELSNNLFKELPFWIFDNVCQLKLLHISGNQLHFRHVNYCNTGIFKSLESLKLENCHLTSEKIRILSCFKNLNVLRIGNEKEENTKRNYIRDLKMDIFKNSRKLMYFYLQNSRISFLPADFDCLRSIQVLDLSDNLLSWLPETFCNLINLRIINFTSNQLLFLPNDIGKLVSLEQVYLGNNKLHQVPDSFYNLKNLEFVDLYNNELEKFEWHILKETKLKGLDLGMNCLNLDICESGDDQISMLYNSIKESYRKHFNCLDNRSDVQNIILSSDNEEKSSDAYSGSGKSIASVESESLSDIEDSLSKLSQKRNQLDENWDEKESNECGDELFDPNELKKFEPENPCLDFWRENFENNYCPAKHHIPSIRETLRRKICNFNETVVDGQFDSD